LHVKRYFVDQPCVSIVGKPSAAMVEKISRQAKERLETTKSGLGEAGLKKKAEELKAAQTENDRPIPSDMITNFPISDASVSCASACPTRADTPRI
jgi:Zn-dependent M16 (insulinase) family peptidase